MKPTLQLKLSQHLTLTPQLQQSIKLLQLSTLELNHEIEKFLLENPMLEREDGDEGDFVPVQPGGATTGSQENDAAPTPDARESTQEMAGYDEAAEWSGAGNRSSGRDDEDDTDFQDFQAAATSLRDHLNQQVGLSSMSDRNRALVRFLIEAIDDDGYLNQTLEELLQLLPDELEVDLEELTVALHQVQSLDPTGVAAQTPVECLSLQLRAMPPGRTRDIALRIVDEHLTLLAERNFVRLKRNLGCSDDELREAHALICTLDPHPGSRYSAQETRYVVPDVVVRRVRGHWTASLNADAMPKLRINALYASILQQNRGISGALTGQLQEARWLIKNVQQRFETILRVSQAIVDQQRQFFEYGEVAMRPLTLREVADALELHESTISRVTTQKFMATPRGVFELKYFFGSHVATDTGGAASSTAIRALIRQLVEAEERKKPLSDSKIAELLGQQGIVVARRTIAKYRESLNIPPVSQRKTI